MSKRTPIQLGGCAVYSGGHSGFPVLCGGGFGYNIMFRDALLVPRDRTAPTASVPPNGAAQQGGFNFGNGADSMDM